MQARSAATAVPRHETPPRPPPPPPQGMLKAEAKSAMGAAVYGAWQRTPADFQLPPGAPGAGRYPVRELWHRASLAWRQLLLPAAAAGGSATVLVVAHNAVNQALLGVAAGLPPAAFRRLLQSNAAGSVVDLTPGAAPGAPAVAVLDRVSQSPTLPLQLGERVTQFADS